jgi:hypothetical protein
MIGCRFSRSLLHCLYCGEQIRRPRGHASVNFCSGAHRTAYYQKAFERPPVSRQLAGFKPSFVAFELHAGVPPEAQEHSQALRLPGVWHLSSLSKRGVSARQGFSNKKVAAAIVAPVRGKPVPVAAQPQRVKKCILPEAADPSNRFGSISQGTTLYVPAVSPAPDRSQEIREAKNSWKNQAETFERPALRGSFGILQRAPEPGLKPEVAIVPAIQATKSQPALNGRWLQQPPRIGLGADRCLPAASRFEREEGPQFTRIGAAAVESRMIETEFVSVPSRRRLPASNPREDLKFRLAATLAVQLGSAVAPSPGIVGPQKAKMGERDRAPVLRPAKVRRPAAIGLPEPSCPHNANYWARVRRPSPHLPEMPVPSELTKNPERVRTLLRFGYDSTARELGPLPAALSAAGQCMLRVPASPMPGECSPIRVPHLRTGSPDLRIRRLAPTVAMRAAAELRPSQTSSFVSDIHDTPMAKNFRQEISIRSSASLIPATLRAAGSAWAGIRHVPDSPANRAFRDRPHASQPQLNLPCDATTPAPQLARLAGSAMHLWVPAEGQIATVEIGSHAPVQHPAKTPSMAPLGIAPALSTFASVGPSFGVRAFLLSGLRERLFSPIPPSSQPRMLKPGKIEISKSVLSLSKAPVALDPRWDRNRRMWDRGGRWKRPAHPIAFADLRFRLGSALGGVHNHRDS